MRRSGDELAALLRRSQLSGARLFRFCRTHIGLEHVTTFLKDR